jgi:hypothetical protein
VESVENSKTEFPTLPTALGNPAQDAGFPHFHSTAATASQLPMKGKGNHNE